MHAIHILLLKFLQVNVCCSCTVDNDRLISMSFATCISSSFKFLPRLLAMHRSISLKKKFFVAIRALWCGIFALVLLLSFQVILSGTSCTHERYHHLLKILITKNILTPRSLHFSYAFLSFHSRSKHKIVRDLVSIPDSIWLEISWPAAQNPFAAISNLAPLNMLSVLWWNCSSFSFCNSGSMRTL